MNKRIGLVGFLAFLSAVIAILVSPPFALAYFHAYGYGAGELAPTWLVTVGSTYPNLIDFMSRIQVYQFYGRIYSLLIPLTLPALFQLKMKTGNATLLSIWGWRIFISGILLSAIGIFGEYCCDPNGFWVSTGFFFEMLGTLVLWIGATVYGIVARKEAISPKWLGIAFIAIAPLGIFGLFFLAHIPSGPLLGYFIYWLVTGFYLMTKTKGDKV